MKGMAKKKRIFSKPFAAAVDHHMRVQGWTNFDMGQAVGYTDGKMLSAIRLERSDGSEDRRRAIAEKLRFSLDAFIKEGERLIEKQNQAHLTATLPSLSIQANASNVTSLDHQHWKVVKQFKQKDTAKQINEILVDIEKMDPGALRYILEEFESRRDVIKKRIEAERKKRENGGDQGK
jgi:hypothetical protein